MWHIPSDLLPGPAFEESRDALSVSRLARCRSLYRSLFALLHAHGGRLKPSQPLRGWKQHVLATLVALAVGLLVVSVVAL
jgi:hypothetical protein